MRLEKGVRLKHYKGGKYRVIEQGTNSETLEDMVIYQNEMDEKIWIRPLNMFYEEVEFKGYYVPRFEESEEYTFDDFQEGKYVKYHKIIIKNGREFQKEMYGWTNLSKAPDYISILCDDDYQPGGGLDFVKLEDIIRILPYKDRYKDRRR